MRRASRLMRSFLLAACDGARRGLANPIASESDAVDELETLLRRRPRADVRRRAARRAARAVRLAQIVASWRSSQQPADQDVMIGFDDAAFDDAACRPRGATS
jgi:hypothetical protein